MENNTIIEESDKPLLRLYLRNEIFNYIPIYVLNDPWYRYNIVETPGFAAFRLSVAFYRTLKPVFLPILKWISSKLK